MTLVLCPDGAPSIPRLLLLSERTALTAFLRGRPCGKRSGHAMASADYFPSRPKGRFTSRGKIAGFHHPTLRYGRCRCARRCRSGPPAAFRRHEGRDERGRSDQGKPP